MFAYFCVEWHTASILFMRKRPAWEPFLSAPNVIDGSDFNLSHHNGRISISWVRLKRSAWFLAWMVLSNLATSLAL